MNGEASTGRATKRLRTADEAGYLVRMALNWRQLHPDMADCPAPLKTGPDLAEWFALNQLKKLATANQISDRTMAKLVKVRPLCRALVLQVLKMDVSVRPMSMCSVCCCAHQPLLRAPAPAPV
jgi:hypothetical protein